MHWVTNVDPEVLGLIPHFLTELDPRPAAEQFDERYQHGGGWSPMSGFKLIDDLFTLQYGDPSEEDADAPLEALAVAVLRDELIVIYPHAWVAIFRPGGGFEVSRMD